MKRLSLIAICVLMAMTLCGETTPSGHGLFRFAPFGQSLYADLHPNFVRLDIPYGTNKPVYDYGGHDGVNYRWQTQCLFGINLPIWTGNLVDSTFALNVTMALSANLWMDFFEFSTSPIVDTDYRIGIPSFTFLHRLNRGFAKNYSIQWSPFKHESTHGFQGIVSAEIRNRECYGFDLSALKTDDPKPMQAERRVFTYNTFAGARYNTPGYDGYFSRFLLGVRAYHGNCPYGQFRSIANYSQIGVCMMFQ